MVRPGMWGCGSSPRVPMRRRAAMTRVSRTVRQLKKAASCWTKASSAPVESELVAGTMRPLLPSWTLTSPPSEDPRAGGSLPVSAFRRLVFPLPLGPRITNSLPCLA
eukprot:CAMPEP_0182903790 /NCGR_PEP_ID=MMETSP0034_2-20130328/31598_1 /TAXON_ID=156128 /ORGANISM="Nephroselmis pyriformis, Strain CCMP717" /LENGTH=106 /DNA_ID=CAMNT_0025038785 /DNA_START=62 /DNA_END=382 /DNA_ORIENTATION=+